jgi:hypothetical protein
VVGALESNGELAAANNRLPFNTLEHALTIAEHSALLGVDGELEQVLLDDVVVDNYNGRFRFRGRLSAGNEEHEGEAHTLESRSPRRPAQPISVLAGSANAAG